MGAKRAAARAASVLLFSLLPGACSLAFPVHVRPDGVGDASFDAPGESGQSTDYRTVVLHDKPVVYLRFGEQGGTVAKDEMNTSPGAYPGGGVTYGVPGAIAGDTDTAIAFDGTAGVKMPAGLDFAGTAAFTLELWARQTKYAGDGLTVDHQQYSPVRDGWLLRLGDGEVSVERWRNGATNGSSQGSTGPLPLGTYHHVVATFDGTLLRLYVDGAEGPTAPLQGTTQLKELGNTWTIGAQNCCSGVAFIGSLDEVAVYDHALTADQIAHHHAIGAGLAPNAP
jgi:hypothetical protein